MNHAATAARPTHREDDRSASFWLSSTADDLTPRNPLRGTLEVDVAILGGGFSGLWTAYYLLRDNPGIEVAVLEKEICGFGASGRNGGWCSPRFPVEPHTLERRIGAEAARATILALHDTVAEVGQVAAEAGIDAHYRNVGLLSLARGVAQLPAIRATHLSYERLGLGAHHRLLSAAEAQSLVRATDIAGALFTPHCATLHPGNLVRGLARAVERLGGVVYENSEVIQLRPGNGACLATQTGMIRARRALVAAGEAYLAHLPPFRREILPLSSTIVLTAPLTEHQWGELGWNGGQCLASQSLTRNYLTRTLDGRILYGSRGAPYLFGSKTSHAALQDERLYDRMRAKVREWFPTLRQVEFTHAWGGYLGMPRDGMPIVSFDPATKLARLMGYTGRGVATTNLAARLLTGLIAGRKSGLEHLPIHRRTAPRWEHEPLRWAAVRYVQNAMGRIDAAEEAGRALPWDAAIIEYLSRQ